MRGLQNLLAAIHEYQEAGHSMLEVAERLEQIAAHYRWYAEVEDKELEKEIENYIRRELM